MFMLRDDTYKPLSRTAWLKLILTYLLSFALSFVGGLIIIKIFRVAPETLFTISTKRISYLLPAFETGEKLGIDPGIMLFTWNTLGAMALLSFLYTARLFNPHNREKFPRLIRKAVCGTQRMKLLCYLPGCRKIDEEFLRRLYVWLMIPWLGMILLGIESGLTVSTSATTFGSYLIGFASLIPHGIIEIPTIAFAGAVTFAAHIMVREKVKRGISARIFENIDDYIRDVRPVRIIFTIVIFLLIAGFVEGHVTYRLIDMLKHR